MKRLYYVGSRPLKEVEADCRHRLTTGVNLEADETTLYVEGEGDALDRFLLMLDWGPSWSLEQGGKLLMREGLKEYLASPP